MKRILFALFAAVALLALLLTAMSGVDATKAALGISLVALGTATAAVMLGVIALRNVRGMRQNLDRVAHSLDGALKTLATISNRNSSTIEELADAVNRDIGRLSERIDRADDDRPVTAGTKGDNVVALPMAARKPRNHSAAAEAVAAPEKVPNGPIEISLEPIVAVSDSTAIGFEAYAGVKLADGEERLTRRLSDLASVKERVRFELALFDAVVAASRRQLGDNARGLALHVAISHAFLQDAAAVEHVTGLFKLHPGLEGQIVLSLPDMPPAAATGIARSIARLTQAGVQFAVEAVSDAEDAIAQMQASGVMFVKLPANRLLDRERGRTIRSGADIAFEASAANIQIVATRVATDEDVLALLDVGVNSMSGPRFSAPRRLKPVNPEPSTLNTAGRSVAATTPDGANAHRPAGSQQ